MISLDMTRRPDGLIRRYVLTAEDADHSMMVEFQEPNQFQCVVRIRLSDVGRMRWTNVLKHGALKGCLGDPELDLWMCGRPRAGIVRWSCSRAAYGHESHEWYRDLDPVVAGAMREALSSSLPGYRGDLDDLVSALRPLGIIAASNPVEMMRLAARIEA